MCRNEYLWKKGLTKRKWKSFIFVVYFTKTPINDLPQHADRVFTISHEEECADTCLLETTMQCNSFYFCPKSSQCLLSRQHVPDGPGVVTVADCFSYSSKFINDIFYYCIYMCRFANISTINMQHA